MQRKDKRKDDLNSNDEFNDHQRLESLIKHLEKHAPPGMTKEEKEAFSDSLRQTYLNALERYSGISKEVFKAETENLQAHLDSVSTTNPYMHQSLLTNLKYYIHSHVNYSFDPFTQIPTQREKRQLEESILEQIHEGNLEELQAQDENGYTALHLAMLTHHVAFVKALHEKGVDMEAKTHSGETPLAIALSQLSYMVWSDAQFTKATEYLLYVALVSRETLDEQSLETLARLEKNQWKVTQQLKAEEKVEKEQEEIEKHSNNMLEIRSSEQDFIESNMTYTCHPDHKHRIADIIAQSIILQNEAGLKIKEEFYQTIIKVLNKLIDENPLIERVLYLYARLAKQELGHENPAHILALTGCVVNYFYNQIPLSPSIGLYTNGDVIAFALNDVKVFVEECAAFVTDKDAKIPGRLTSILHEMIHMLLNKLYQNLSRIHVSESEDWKTAFMIHKAFLEDLRSAENYLEKNENDETARLIYNHVKKSFSSDKNDIHLYHYSELSSELPAHYIQACLLKDGINLLEKMFPNATNRLIYALNVFYLNSEHDFPNSELTHQTGILKTQAEQAFNSEAERRKATSKNNDSKSATSIQRGFFNTQKEKSNKSQLVAQLNRITAVLELEWKPTTQDQRRVAWTYVDDTNIDTLQHFFKEHGITVDVKKAKSDKRLMIVDAKWISLLEKISALQVKRDHSH